MNDDLKKILDKLDGIEFKASTNDLPKILQNVTTIRAHVKALSEFIIETFAEIKNEESDKLLDDFESLLAKHIADEFSQFFSDSDRMK